MMFNGFPMSADSDGSDLNKASSGSGGGSPGSESGAWGADAANYYHSKLMSTLQVLQNREETLSVQSDSLRVAEAHIADLRAQLDSALQQLRGLRCTLKKEKTDASVSCTQEEQSQQNLVRVLRTNVAIIGDLYRECFYENAKQEEMIEILRRSYLEMRRDSQREQSYTPELDQNIALEVDNLKMEITNFLSNSNNDSGVWECSGAAGTLRALAEQLHALHALLTDESPCELEEENKTLITLNQTKEVQLNDLRKKVSELEAALLKKEDCEVYKKQLDEKNNEIEDLRLRLAELVQSATEKSIACETYMGQLQQAQVLIRDKNSELLEVRRKISALEADAARAQELADECSRVREQAAHAEGRERAGHEQLARAVSREREQCRCLQEEADRAAGLHGALLEAHERGAALAAQVRGLLGAARRWVRRARDRQREQEEKMKEQDAIIRALQQQLQNTRNSNGSKVDVCTKCVSVRSRLSLGSASETAGSSKCGAAVGERRGECSGTSGSERASVPKATPARRLLKKRSCTCDIDNWWATIPRAVDSFPPQTPPRSVSPTAELQQRVLALQDALLPAHHRWCHSHAQTHTRHTHG